MPPGRRKGGNRGEAKGQLSLGDLVLAKVKGFPAWPAKISRAEDWDRLPDPKKYFVYFFGTSEIAFVAPADIQVFNDDTKSKLIARSRGKCSKDFGRAVEEICEAFERLHGKCSESSGRSREENDTSKITTFGSKVTAINEDNLNKVGMTEEQGEKYKLKAEDNEESSHDELPESGYSSQDRDEILSSFVKGKNSDSNNGTEAPYPCVKKENRSSGDSMRVLREREGLAVKQSSNISSLKSEKSPSSGHEFGKENGIKECSGEVNADSKFNASDMNTPQDSVDIQEGCGDHGTVDLVLDKKRRGTAKPQKKCASKKHPQECSYEELHEIPKCEGQLKDKITEKTAHSLDKGGEASPSTPVQNLDDSREKVSKSSTRPTRPLVGNKKTPQDQLHKETKLVSSKKNGTERLGSFGDSPKQRNHVNSKKQKLDTSDESQPRKKPRLIDDVVKKFRRSGKSDLAGNKDNTLKQTSISLTKSAKHMLSTEGSLRRDSHQSLDTIAKAAKVTEDARGSNLLKKEISSSDHKKSPVHTHTRRRTFRIDDDEDDEARRTPVHRETTSMSMMSDLIHSSQFQAENNANSQPSNCCMPNGKLDFAKLDENFCKDKTSPCNLGGPLKQSPGQTEESRQVDAMEPIGKHVSPSPGGQEDRRLASRDGRANKSSRSVSLLKSTDHKIMKAEIKSSSVALKAKVISYKPSTGGSDNSNHSYNHATQKTKTSSLERMKNTQKVNLQKSTLTENRSDINFSAERSLDKSSSLGERFLAPDDRIGNSVSESATSMRHLIAVAQAKRRQTHSQDPFHDKVIGVSTTPSVIQERSPSPFTAAQPISTASLVQKDVVESFPSTSCTPPAIAQNYISVGYLETDGHERMISPGILPHRGSLSGGTEAAVARDALEGMIETLSRTKESIGRATRLAIDCAKYGMASEVLDLLIRKLESELSFHRKVDLFFLVDSITQCSHSQKGIAGASYIPAVQAVLPRLLGAAAPPGAAASENHRQCLKVLRLWLERRIFPESFLRPLMDGIEVPNDGVGSAVFLRRPSRAERSVDDPIREMDGMLVDEYGSNAAFQLPGFLSTHLFEDEDELPGSLPDDAKDKSPIEPGSSPLKADTCVDFLGDRRHHILEDVDGELEMEDVSVPSRDDHASVKKSSSAECDVTASVKSLGPTTALEMVPSSSPPLPLDAPPSPPPLPPSPPPPPPPPPPPSSPPPPPPPPPFPPLPSFPPPSVPPASPSLQFHPSGHQDNCGTSSGPNKASLKTETMVQQSPNFAAVGVCNSQPVPCVGSSRSHEFVQNDMYVATQGPHTNQPFQPAGASFVQRPYHVLMPGHSLAGIPLPAGQVPVHYPASTSQPPTNNFSYVKSMVEHHVRQQFHPYSLTSDSNGRRHYVVEEQWRMHSGNVSSDSQHNSWVNGGRPQTSSGSSFVQDGFFGSNVERPPQEIQFPSHAPVAPVTSMPVPPSHVVPQILHCRPDAPAINCWRPS